MGKRKDNLEAQRTSRKRGDKIGVSNSGEIPKRAGRARSLENGCKS